MNKFLVLTMRSTPIPIFYMLKTSVSVKFQSGRWWYEGCGGELVRDPLFPLGREERQETLNQRQLFTVQKTLFKA